MLTLVATRGRDFPLAMLARRLRCRSLWIEKCGRRFHSAFGGRHAPRGGLTAFETLVRPRLQV